MMFRFAFILFSLSFLTACGGGSDSSSDSTNTDTVSLTGSWNEKNSISICSGVESSQPVSLNDTDSNGAIDEIAAFTGTSINEDTCQLESADGYTGTLNEGVLPTPINKTQMISFAKQVYAENYGIDENSISVEILEFSSNKISVKATSDSDYGITTWEK